VVTLKIEIKKKVEERKRTIEKAVEEALKEGWASNRDQAYLFVPKSLTKNVVLDVIEVGEVAVILHGDDRLGEGFVKKIELRLRKPVALSAFKRWAEEGVLKAVQYALCANGAAPPPKTKEEEEEYIRFKEKLAVLKHELGLLGDRP
jgi:hypothetical protein